jgi:glycosyltransferase involved in cell wall biosynthesis/GT2 family glycosyltransferase
VTEWRGRERALRALGVDVTVLAAREWHAGGTEVRLDAGEETGAVPVRTWGRHPALFVYAPGPLWRALGESWDVLDIHEEPFALATAEVLVLRALRRRRPPVVLYTAQNIRKRYPPPFRWLERWALRSAAGISACNTDAAAIVVGKGFAGDPRVIPLGIDPDAFAAVASRDAGGKVKGTITVGLLGRLVPEKGIDTLLLALALDPRLRARIAGSGPLAASIPRRAADLGIADRVDLVGAVAPEAVGDFYRSIDVLAVPSTATPRWTEQFGRVAIEAMAAGVPVVVSDAGALPEVVGEAGIVVPQRHPVELAAALRTAAGERAKALRAAGLRRARECSWDAVAREYLDLYHSVRHEPAREADDASRGVEVVVVAYGSPALVRTALAPLAGVPVTVVDNSSLPEIAEIARELGARYLDAGRNGGFGAGVNIALGDRLVPGADVLLLNPDARISPDSIGALQRHLRASADLASVAPAQTDDAGHPARVAWPFPSPRNAWLEAVGLGRLQRGPRYVIGSVLLLRAEALAQVGRFDERFFLYAEETDWAYRAHRLGWRHEVASRATAVHLGAATSTDSRRRDAHFYGSQERYLRKHFGAAGWQTARVANWLGASVRAVLLRGDRARAARRRAAVYHLGPMTVEARFREPAP